MNVVYKTLEELCHCMKHFVVCENEAPHELKTHKTQFEKPSLRQTKAA